MRLALKRFGLLVEICGGVWRGRDVGAENWSRGGGLYSAGCSVSGQFSTRNLYEGIFLLWFSVIAACFVWV
jgi:hypothetical protein